MANLPGALDFAKTEEEICAKWAAEETFKKQDSLSIDRGDEVRYRESAKIEKERESQVADILCHVEESHISCPCTFYFFSTYILFFCRWFF
mmetsp:Transcript_11932/g.22676  ORF Transcript_11932/g.22676 Transcript_11932/m.22676 type:complete len:91 (-) Transcript_11932:904-1176(-)